MLFFDAIPKAGGQIGASQHTVLAVQERGNITAFSADLSEEEWTTSLQEMTQEAVKYPAANIKERFVKHAFCISGRDARDGLLKDREDLLASLNPAGSSEGEALEHSTLLCVMSRSQSENIAKLGRFDLDVFAFQPQIQGLSRPPMRLLVRWTVPKLSVEVAHDVSTFRIQYNAVTGTLHQLIGGTLVTYEFNALGPRIVSEIRLPKEPISSFFPLPHDLALISTPASYSLVNLRYKSIQSTISAASSTQMQSRKRKRANSSNSAIRPALFANLFDYFPGEDTVVAIFGQDLVSFPVRLPPVSRTRHSINSSRLIDSLGRGTRSTNSAMRTAPQLPTATTVAAWVRSDPGLSKLSRQLIDREPIALSGAVEAMKHLLRSFNSPRPAAVPQTHLLTNGSKTPNGVDLTEDDAGADIIALEDAALTADLERARAFLSPKSLTTRGKALKMAVSLLGATFPAQDVSRAMREQLSRRDIMFLIELLRIDLHQGGWTSHVLDIWPGEAADKEKGDDAALAVVTKVLTRAVDALGMGAWLTAADDESDEDSIDDRMSVDGEEKDDDDPQTTPGHTHATVTALREEISGVLECAQEAAWFSNFLFDFVRYQEVAKNSKKPAIAIEEGLTKIIDVAPNITTTTTTSAEALAKELMLPLGVRAAKGIESTVVRAGGEIRERSKRETGHEMSKRVAEYSFERIRV